MAGGGAPVDGGAAAAAGSVCVGTGDDGITLCGAAMDGGFTGSVPSITVPSGRTRTVRTFFGSPNAATPGAEGDGGAALGCAGCVPPACRGTVETGGGGAGGTVAADPPLGRITRG